MIRKPYLYKLNFKVKRMERIMKVFCLFLIISHLFVAQAQTIKVALVQSHLVWGDVDANLKAFDKRVEACEPCDLIVFPELFVSGCEMKKAEKKNKYSVAGRFEDVEVALRNWAVQKRAVVIGSTVYALEGKFYNRLIAAFPDSTILYYDKHNCFKKGSFSPGKEPLIFVYKGVRFATYICYDLRFPEWSRSGGLYDAAIYIANWPASRREDWNRLLRERAIENHVHVVAVNCAGTDPYGLYYAGDSQLLDPEGEVMTQCGEGLDEIQYGVILSSEKK